MRLGKLLLVVSLVLALGACSCRTKKVGSGDENLPIAGEASALKDVTFGFDSYSLDEASKGTLKANAEWLKANPSVATTIEGHCDERGTGEYNMVLGSNRARAVRDFVRSLGVEAERLSTVSYGEEIPLDAAHNEEAWAKNRRAHFTVNKK
jgi:peptidoglycan-associated lipoprotein